VIVTIEGEDKREAFARVRAGDPAMPVSHIAGDHVLWLVDPAVAGES
jgi:6-phosphogluconolactonase